MQKTINWARFGFLVGAWIFSGNLSAQTFTNDVRVYSYSFLIPIVSGSGLSVYFSTPDNNGLNWPQGVTLSGGFVNPDKITFEAAPEALGSSRYRSDFLVLSPAYRAYVAYGDATVDNVPATDANNDGFPDVLQWDQAGSFNTSGQIQYVDLTLGGSTQSRNTTLRFTRSKGSATGSCAMMYPGSGITVSLSGSFVVPALSGKTVVSKSGGSFTSSLTANFTPLLKSAVSANVRFPGGNTIALTGVTAVDRSNNAVMGTSFYNDLTLTQRISGTFKGYVGQARLNREEPAAPFPSYVDRYIVMDCPDTDEDGSLDLTDETPLGLPPDFTGAGQVVGEVGRAIAPVTVGVSPLCRNFTATGLPPGLAINLTSGVISGTPTVAGIHTFRVTARVKAGLAPATTTFTAWVGGAAQTLPFTDNFSSLVPNRYLFSSTQAFPRMMGTNGLLEYRSTNPPQNTAWATPSLLLPLTNSWDLQVDAQVPTNWPSGDAKVGVSLLKDVPGGTFPDILPNRINLKFAISSTNGNRFQYHYHVEESETQGNDLATTNTGLARLRFLFHGGTRQLTLWAASYNGTNLSPWIQLGEESLASTNGLGQQWGLQSTNRLRLALWGETDSIDGNANGSRRMALDNLAIVAVTPPRITGVTNFIGQVGVTFSNRLTATNGQTYFTAANLPADLVLNETSGVISGVPQLAGRFTNAVVGAGNPAASSSNNASFTILPAFVSPGSVTGFVNDAGFSHRIEVGTNNFGNNLKYTASGLPTGMSINASNGVISGKPTVAGTFPATVTITAFGASASQRVDFRIHGAAGGTFSLTLNPRPTNVLNLPAGLSYNKASGVISGIPQVWGSFTATGQLSNGTTTNIEIPVMPSVPVIAGSTNWGAQVGQETRYQIVAGGFGREWAGWDGFEGVFPSTNWLSSGPLAAFRTNASTKSGVGNYQGRLTLTQAGNTNQTGSGYLVWARTIPVGARWTAMVEAGISTNLNLVRRTNNLGQATNGQWIATKLSLLRAGGEVAEGSRLTAELVRSPEEGNMVLARTNSSAEIGESVVPTEGAGLALRFDLLDTLSAQAIPEGNPVWQRLHTLSLADLGFQATNQIRLALGGFSEFFLLSPGLVWMDNFVVLPDPDSLSYRAYLVGTNGLALTNEVGQPYLPEGFDFDSSSGSIQGIPSASLPGGTYRIRVEAEYNPPLLPIQGLPAVKGGTNVTLTLLPAFTGTNAATFLLNASNRTHTVGVGSHNFGSGLRFTATGLPTGLAINATSGVIAGRPTAAGTFSARVTITAGTATASQDLLLSVHNGGGNTWAVGSPVSYQVNLGTGVSGYQATGLPTGLTINASSGLISGTPVFAGTNLVAVQGRIPSGAVAEVLVSFSIGRATPLFPNMGSPQFRRTNQVSYPSIFFAWSPQVVDRLAVSNTVIPAVFADIFRHDLGWVWSELDLKWNDPKPGQASYLTPTEIAARRKELQGVLSVKPSMISLIELHYRDAPRGGKFLPEDSPFWLRKTDGQIEDGWSEGSYGRLDFSHPQFQDLLAARAKSLMDANLADGILLDWWNEFRNWPDGTLPNGSSAGQSELEARKQLLQKIRTAIGEDKLIFGNSNYDILPETGPGIDGVFMECWTPDPPSFPPAENWNPSPYALRDWGAMEDALKWFSTPGNLRSSGFTCLEMWARYGRTDPRDLKTMRAGLAMSLCLSDGYYAFGEPNWWKIRSGTTYVDVDDHRHSWYYHWDKSLGLPLESPRSSLEEGGYYRREFQNGWVVYNPASNGSAVSVSFTQPMKRVSTNQTASNHVVEAGDGDLFVRP